MREVWIMKYKDKKVQDVQIAYIGGGSRGWAWTFMTDLALEPDMSGTIRLYDIDREAAEANEVIGNAVSALKNTVAGDLPAMDLLQVKELIREHQNGGGLEMKR